MTHDQKINYLRIAFQLQDVNCTNQMCDRIITTYERLMKRKGKFSVRDAVDIDFEMKAKYQQVQDFEELDEIENSREV